MTPEQHRRLAGKPTLTGDRLIVLAVLALTIVLSVAIYSIVRPPPEPAKITILDGYDR